MAEQRLNKDAFIANILECFTLLQTYEECYKEILDIIDAVNKIQGGDLTIDTLKSLIEGSEYISFDENETGSKLVINLDRTHLDTTPTKDSDHLITSGGVQASIYNVQKGLQENIESSVQGMLKLPIQIPTEPLIVSIGTNNAQTNIAIGDGLAIKDGHLVNTREGGSSDIPDNSITTAKIVNLAVTSDKLAANSVNANKIVSNAVTGAKIASGAIDGTKLSTALNNQIKNSLQLPQTAPSAIGLVGINTSNTQVNIPLGDGLSIDSNGKLIATGGGGSFDPSKSYSWSGEQNFTKINVGSTSSFDNDATFSQNIIAQGYVSSNTTPTLASHLTRKDYVDGLVNAVDAKIASVDSKVASKVDKINVTTGTVQAYVQSGATTQGVKVATIADGNTIARRRNGGQVQTATPSQGDDAVNLTYFNAHIPSTGGVNLYTRTLLNITDDNFNTYFEDATVDIGEGAYRLKSGYYDIFNKYWVNISLSSTFDMKYFRLSNQTTTDFFVMVQLLGRDALYDTLGSLEYGAFLSKGSTDEQYYDLFFRENNADIQVYNFTIANGILYIVPYTYEV